MPAHGKSHMATNKANSNLHLNSDGQPCLVQQYKRCDQGQGMKHRGRLSSDSRKHETSQGHVQRPASRSGYVQSA
jgi:hypothetical protein